MVYWHTNFRWYSGENAEFAYLTVCLLVKYSLLAVV